MVSLIFGPLVSHDHECIHLFLNMFYCLSNKGYLLLCSDHPGLLVCGRGQAGAAHHEGSRADRGAEVEPGPAKLVAAHAG